MKCPYCNEEMQTGAIHFDSIYKLFSNNDYELKWLDNKSVEIIYGFYNENVYKEDGRIYIKSNSRRVSL